TKSQSDSPLPTSTATTSTITTTTTLPSPPLQSTTDPILVSKAVDKIVTDAVDWAMQALLRARFRDLPTSVELDYSNQCLADQEEARKNKRKRRESPRTPPGSLPTQPPPPTHPTVASGALGTSRALGFSQLPPPPLPTSIGTFGFAQQQGS
ncbi:hypothetical protein Tco_0240013, partial [Tanacetum coccineum]